VVTDEEKRQRKIDRVMQRFRTLRIHICINETATLFQKLTRIRAIEPDGKLTCCSCGKRDYPGRGFHGGHWIGRSAKSTIFDGRNCHPQCAACNRFGTGPVKANYDEFMRKKYGRPVMNELRMRASEDKQWTREELAIMCVRFREDLNRIIKGEQKP